MKRFLIIGVILFFGFNLKAQVGINNTNPKASLDITATNAAAPSNTDGVLIPRIDAFPSSDPGADQHGMMVYLTTTSGGNPPGFYYWDNNAGPAAWNNIAADYVATNGVGSIDDLFDGKSDSDGTQDGSSIFIGIGAGINDDGTDNKNVGLGYQTLNTHNIAGLNTAIGYQVLTDNEGGFNTGVGGYSLLNNTTGALNTSIGYSSLYNNTDGAHNVALGYRANYTNTSGDYNVAIGSQALHTNNSTGNNVAVGSSSLYSSTTGTTNTAIGVSALLNNITGSNNTALGSAAGLNNVGSDNVFIGRLAGSDETGDDKLYIENSNANADNALIYGEFDNNILRTNGEFQIGNPSTTGYKLPTTDGSSGQVLSTDGSGQLSFTTNTGVEKLNDLSDAKSDVDGSEDGSSIFIGIGAGIVDDSSDNQNISIGFESLNSNTTGAWNVANGYQALHSQVIGSFNTAIGYQSSFSNTGYRNTAMGYKSLFSNTTGGSNVALGLETLYTNTTGTYNSAMGYQALYNNIGSNYNTANGSHSLYFNTSGSYNTASGSGSLNANTSGSYNSAYGFEALKSSTTGLYNTAYGSKALEKNNVGQANVALGFNSGGNNTSGSSNVFIGHYAGYSETGSNKLYIENSNVNSDNSLIYGEFDNNILRTNSEFQIGNPSGTGYKFPTTDGSSGQVLTTDGSGQLAFTTNTDNDSINNLTDGKSDNDGSNDGSSIFLGINAGQNDDFSNNKNIGVGYNSLNTNIIGTDNIAIGYNSLFNNISSSNIALGTNALYNNTDGYTNVGIGNQILYQNTEGFRNIAIGDQSLYQNTIGDYNTSLGYQTLYTNTSGIHNFGVGYRSLYFNTSGSHNFSIGYQSLYKNTTGNDNISLGYSSMYNTTTGYNNIAIGKSSLTANTTGHTNIAIGLEALNNSTGSSNIAIGWRAGFYGASGSSNVYLGKNAGYNHTGDNTLWIENSSANEDNALIYGEFDNNILRTNSEFQIGNPTGTGYSFPTTDGTANQLLQTNGSGSINWIDKTTIQDADWYESGGTAPNSINDNIYTYGKVGLSTTAPDTKLHLKHINSGASGGFKIENTSANYWRMYVSSGTSGDLRFYSSKNGGTTITGAFNGTTGNYTSVSDRRLKKDFKNLYFTWNKFMSLQPLTYLFKSQNDKKRNIGFVAQDVLEIYPELVSYNEDEDIYHLDYSSTGIVAIKAVQELKKEVDHLKIENQKLKERLSKYEALEKRISLLENNSKNNTDLVTN